ncbi:DEAD/DEAH box helicase [Anaeromyxobacter sp. PSR-1]|uniref:DEAD/DEAH box helicase n=1 Tax=Anaeromyxobacter sp. PSR-1 TaxID=1300915 RepID=UPI0005E97B85|nr:DEAD/DEAH box helicase [Anaeromyxobacter sp. PSR-1]GAO03496.1 DEAD-box ATP-dependent RNA helicase CshA [Anaeromyxobacter sp. PSR-1]
MEEVHGEAPSAAPSDYVSEASFDDMGLSEPVRRAVAEHGYTKPTPVQSATFRPIRDGKDVIVRSKTGTGKTAAFTIPILERIPDGRRKPSALVMCPTRELAIQVAEEVTALAKHRDLGVVTIYGGASMGDQLDKLKAGAEIVVGTPGRIYDHIRRKTLRLEEVMVCCLDEADEMLNMGFFEEVTRILDHLPADVQQLLFSATVPADIEQIIHDYLSDPETILLSGDEYKVENIHNVMYPTVDAYPKPRNLLYMIGMEEPEAAIIFCNTRSDTSLVTAVLNRNGYDAELLNGDLPQKERERVMAKVKRGEVRFMVATDIAARGIDISDLSHVINYSLPEDPAVFLHRVGRTGRIGKKGTSLSLVSGADLHTLTALQKKYEIVFEKKALPTPEEARKIWTDRHVAVLKDAMSASIFEAYIPLAQELRNRPDGEYLISFALKYFFTHQRMEKAQDREKAEHKRTEHERRVQPETRAAGEGRREGGEGRREGGRERSRDRGRERDRGERGRRGGRDRDREAPAGVRAESPAAPNGEGTPAVEVAAEGGAPAAPQRARVFLTLGEQDGADEARVREALRALAPELEPVGVEVRRSHSYVDVPPAALEATVAALDGKEWNGKKLAAEKARRRRR